MRQTPTENSEKKLIQRARRRRFLKLAVIIIIAVAVVIWLALWLHHRFTHVSTNDAQVASHVITVSSRLDGRVTGFDLIRGDELAKGDVVARLYSKPARLKLDELNAEIAHIKTQLGLAGQQISGGVDSAKARLVADQAAVKAAQARMSKAHSNYVRAERLYKAHSGTEKQRDIYHYDYESAKAEYKKAQSQIKLDKVAIANAKTGLLAGGQITNPDVLKTQLKIAQAKQAHQQNMIHDLVVRSKIDGVVDQTFIEKDEYVSAGQPILMMHDPQDVWITAKVKETSVRYLTVGQSVSIHVDAHPDTTYKGRVQVIGNAATNQFALLPNPNPSGNFTKITQRIPVRIKIVKGPRKKLSPGMMVEVGIDVSDDGDAGD
jgi:membrane fusion protein (multidrug efflux system)